jgi:glutathione synthase/RimK-type ligase-like ATP-grasp enzyme
MKIGIVLNYKKAEKKKDELLSLNSKKNPWLKLGKEDKYKNHVITVNSKKYVPADVAIGLYLESHFDDIEVDYITPEEISTRRFKKNDIVFVIIYDLLESFHLSDTATFKRYKNSLKNSPNIYPPYKYQKFINNKCSYYDFLTKKGIPVAPTFCITKEKWYTKSPQNYVKNLLKKVKSKKWDSIITKPVYGQEAIGFKKFIDCQKNPKDLINYLDKNMHKFKSIVIQEYIPGFDKNKPEIRTYFINGVYAYSIITTSDIIGRSIQEGGKYKFLDNEWKYIKKLAQNVMDILPKFDLPVGMQQSILTRIDIGSGLDESVAKYGYFVNEVEFVPSLYIEDHNYPVVEKISKSLVKLAPIYKDLQKGVDVLL